MSEMELAEREERIRELEKMLRDIDQALLEKNRLVGRLRRELRKMRQ